MVKKIVKLLISAVIILALLIGGVYAFNISTSKLTLSGEGLTKTEEIQPNRNQVKVWSTEDTNVIFTDVETGKKYEVGYVTPGMKETIKLEKGHWYKVSGKGDLTVGPVNARIQCK